MIARTGTVDIPRLQDATLGGGVLLAALALCTAVGILLSVVLACSIVRESVDGVARGHESARRFGAGATEPPRARRLRVRRPH